MYFYIRIVFVITYLFLNNFCVPNNNVNTLPNNDLLPVYLWPLAQITHGNITSQLGITNSNDLHNLCTTSMNNPFNPNQASQSTLLSNSPASFPSPENHRAFLVFPNYHPADLSLSERPLLGKNSERISNTYEGFFEAGNSSTPLVSTLDNADFPNTSTHMTIKSSIWFGGGYNESADLGNLPNERSVFACSNWTADNNTNHATIIKIDKKFGYHSDDGLFDIRDCLSDSGTVNMYVACISY